MTILLIFLLSAINASFSVAISKQGNGATIKVEKSDPIGYGAFLQDPNLYTATSINGYHQGQFTIMDHNGNQMAQETVDIPGNDISVVYPWYFNNYIMDSTTNNNYTDPWNNIGWLNLSAHNAENDTLSPYSFNTVWNSYSMSEGSTLEAPLNSTIPMQVDLTIGAIGPKMLKFNFLTDNPSAVTINNRAIISPSGKRINIDFQMVQYNGLFGSVFHYYYIAFVAHEVGVYKLLVDAFYGKPASLQLEFLSFNIATLTTDIRIHGGNGDESPNIQDRWDSEWSSNWYKISGTKGDKLRLDLGSEYALMPSLINIWYPCENGYLLETGVNFGIEDLFFPSTGDIFISLTDVMNGNVQKYSLLLTEIESTDYTIGGGNLTTVKVSRDERKALDFTIEEDSFVEINYTSYGLGSPIIAGFNDITFDFTPNATTFLDAKKQSCFQTITEIEKKFVDNMTFHYYYLPAGSYEALIYNTDIKYDGVIQISSEYITHNNNTIPINNLVYPDTNPSTFQSITFTPDDYYTSLKDAQWIEINITEPGQYQLNTTIWLADNPSATATGSPTYLYTYNDSATPQYTDSAYPIWAFGSDAGMTNDFFYIGSPCRYTGMLINFSTPGIGGTMSPYVHDAISNNWGYMSHDDSIATGTDELTQDGIIEFNSDSDWRRWGKGFPSGTVDIPDVDENDYYWLRLDCITAYTTVPVIELITLLNITIDGDINLALLRDSGYQYCDYWEPDQPSDINGLRVNLDEDLDDYGNPFNFDSDESYIIESSDPLTIGFETGVYKLLIIPEKWCYSGPITVQFAVENFWNYNVFAEYNITAEPSLHAGYINNYTASGYGIDNATIYPYGLVSVYNNSLVEATGEGYLILKCYGEAYQWTQLVLTFQNVSTSPTWGVDVYLMQDLPWIDNSGPNNEAKLLLESVLTNTTHEFGVFNENFYLIFECTDDGDDMITFRIALSQYNTTAIYTEAPISEIITPGIDPVVVVWIIIIAAIIGGAAVVIVVILKKRG